MVLLSLNDLRKAHGVMVVLVRSNCRAAGGARTMDVAAIAHTQACHVRVGVRRPHRLATGWRRRQHVNSA
eukprot:994099-Prymnesium_polylepis.1